jgi:hypothetical protein
VVSIGLQAPLRVTASIVRTNPVSQFVPCRMSALPTRRMKNALETTVPHNATSTETVPIKAARLVAILQQKRFKHGDGPGPVIAPS